MEKETLFDDYIMYGIDDKSAIELIEFLNEPEKLRWYIEGILKDECIEYDTFILNDLYNESVEYINNCIDNIKSESMAKLTKDIESLIYDEHYILKDNEIMQVLLKVLYKYVYI